MADLHRYARTVAAVAVSLVPVAGLCGDGPSPAAPEVSTALPAGGFFWHTGEAEPIAGPHIENPPSFAPDGDGLIVLQTRRANETASDGDGGTADNDFRLIYWNRLSCEPAVTWRYHCQPGERLAVNVDKWFPDSQRVAVRLRRTFLDTDGMRHEENTFLILNALHGTVRSLVLPPGDIHSESISADGNRVAIPVNAPGTDGAASVLLLDSDCRVLKTLDFPSAAHSVLVGGSWIEGQTLEFWRVEQNDTHADQMVAMPYVIDFDKGTVRRRGYATVTFPSRNKAGTQNAPKPVEPLPLPLRLLTAPEPDTPEHVRITDVWLEPAEPAEPPETVKTPASKPVSGADLPLPRRLLLAGDAEGIRLMGTLAGSAGAIYRTHGTLLYAPLLRDRKGLALSPAAP